MGRRYSRPQDRTIPEEQALPLRRRADYVVAADRTCKLDNGSLTGPFGERRSECDRDPKEKTPPKRAFFSLISAVGAFPCNARNVRPRNADIGQFAVAELRELLQARVVAPPSAEEVEDCDQHCCHLSARPCRATRSSLVGGKIRFHGALQQVPCCAAVMHKTHG